MGELVDTIKGKTTNWRMWKRGLTVAILAGIFTFCAGFAIFTTATWKELVAFLVVCIGKDGLLYLQKHPVDEIEDTVHLQKVYQNPDIKDEKPNN